MGEDTFALAEKIIKDVDNVISKDPDLYEFDIILVEDNLQNKSPVKHLEHSLGLESWCVKHVYMYCYSELADKYLCKPRRRISTPSSMNSERLTKLLNVTLLLNPEISSLWNKRREMVQSGLLEKNTELRFTMLVLSRKPKCNDAFAYRRWLLELIFKDETLDDNVLVQIIYEDLHICQLASDKASNNYHSWNHRIWLLTTLKKTRTEFEMYYLYLREYRFTEKWTSKHISDYSCFHYRQFCIKNIFNITDLNQITLANAENLCLRANLLRVIADNLPDGLRRKLLEEEFVLSADHMINILLGNSPKNCNCKCNDLILCRKLDVLFHELVLNNELSSFYKYHETLWYHRRFIVHELLGIIYDHFDFVRQNGALVQNICKKCNLDDLRYKQSKIVRYDSNRIYASPLFNLLVKYEKDFIEDRIKDSDNYAHLHQRYLKEVEGLNNVF